MGFRRQAKWMSVIKNFSKTDKTILSGALLLLLALSYLLYDDSLILPHNAASSSSQAIGTIFTSDNDVRRKNVDNFVWYPGAKKDMVYNKDSIFTGDRSNADIQLNDGSVIHIQENSLVNLNLKDGQMQLDLRYGQFVGNSKNGALKVKSGDEEYTVKGTDAQFEINRSQTGALDVRVLSGNAEIDSKKGKEVLKPHESLQISKNGINKGMTEVEIRLITKDSLVLYRSTDKDPLNFQWDPRGNLDQFQIEFSKTPDFKTIAASEITDANQVNFKSALREGTYYWRVQGLDDRRKPLATSKVEKFFLSYLQAPQVLFPEKNANLKTTSLPTKDGSITGSTKIMWNADPRLAEFEWQVSKDMDFKSVTAQKNVKEKESVASNLSQNTYYLRVRGFDKDHRSSPWSEPQTFKMDIVAEAKPPPPHLLQAKVHFQIPKPEDRTPSSEAAPKLAWSDVDEASNYHWEVSRTPQFTGSTTGDTEDTRLTWPNPKPGLYYYRVYSRSDLGQLSDPSETGELEVFGGTPMMNPVTSTLVKNSDVNAVPPAKEVPVSWSSIPDAKSYVVQYDQNPDFSNPKQVESTGTQSKVTLPEPGKYFARVKAVGENGRDLTEFSSIQPMIYTFHHLLKGPDLAEPMDQTTIFMQKDTAPYTWLVWHPVNTAHEYELQVSMTPDFARPIIKKTTKDTRFLIRDRIPYGNVYWRVRAIAEDAELSSDWSGWTFTIYHQKNQGM